MQKDNREREVKFYLSDQARFQARLEAVGAHRVGARTHEVNLRFDNSQGDLTRQERVLRLRQDTQARVTYKGPSETEAGVRSRQEIEFTVDNHAAARALFEALGYQVSLMYEKYRTTYQLGDTLVTLDEMPFGIFAEIEGQHGEAIRAAAARLGLNWEARALGSYTALFDVVRSSLGLSFQDLTFENFKAVSVPPEALGVHPADQS